MSKKRNNKEMEDLQSKMTSCYISLSNSSISNFDEALRSMVSAAREIGFAEGQRHCSEIIEDILRGNEE